MRLLGASLAVLGALAACSSFAGDPVEPVDAGADDAGEDTGDADRPTDGGGGDTSMADAGGDADAAPADMVFVSVTGAPNSGFYIDRTEVKAEAYDAFAVSVNSNVGDAGWAGFPGCQTKTMAGPPTSCAPPSGPGFPITCVDWCDASAYCRFRGKRLCGALSGGAVSTADEKNPTVGQWTRACAGVGGSAHRFPYGLTADKEACNANAKQDAGTAMLPVASFPSCSGSVAGLFDMSGNASEWVDSCVGAQVNDNCVTKGGDWASAPSECDEGTQQTRLNVDPRRGFRCCKD